MSKPDLSQPLANETPSRESAPRRRALLAPLLVSTALVVALIAALWVAVVDDPDGGRPVAVAKIEDAVPTATGSIGAADSADDAADSADADASVTVAAATAPPALPEEALPQSDTLQLAGLPQLPPRLSGDPSLFEQSSFGPLPRVSPDGRRPREAYAGRAAPVPAGVPRVVIVVGGLGLSQTGTQNALDTLPPEVTLAFAPYGSSLERWVGKAREKGHEVLLQIPLEPMSAEESPGEHTLLAAGGAENRSELHWALGRVTAYAGVMNHMGARFLQDERAMVPFLGEVGERGLYYLDDGSTPQSLAATIGAALHVPVVTADRTLDRVRSGSAIENELMELEADARTNGLAVGIATAFPSSIEPIARWIADAQSRGIVVIPASAATGS